MKAVVLAVCLVTVAATAPMTAQSKLDFTLTNSTGLIVAELYVSPTNVADWEEDILGKDVLKDGESVEVTFSRAAKSCKWDLKIVDEDDDSVVWNNLDLCKASEITLQYKNGTPTALVK